MNNEKIDIQSGQENEPDRTIYPVRDVIEALDYIESQSPERGDSAGMTKSEYIRWAAHVIESGLPGSDLIGNIEDLDNMTFDESQSVIAVVKPMIDEARMLLVSAYKKGVDETLGELNAFISANPGLFVIDNPHGSPITDLGAGWVNETALLIVNTATQDSNQANNRQLYVDITGLDDDTKRQLADYHAESGLQ